MRPPLNGDATAWRLRRIELLQAEALALEALLEQIENVQAALEEDEKLLSALYATAALVRDRRNDFVNMARRLEALMGS